MTTSVPSHSKGSWVSHVQPVSLCCSFLRTRQMRLFCHRIWPASNHIQLNWTPASFVGSRTPKSNCGLEICRAPTDSIYVQQTANDTFQKGPESIAAKLMTHPDHLLSCKHWSAVLPQNSTCRDTISETVSSDGSKIHLTHQPVPYPTQ